jgi:hypothetical protein
MPVTSARIDGHPGFTTIATRDPLPKSAPGYPIGRVPVEQGEVRRGAIEEIRFQAMPDHQDGMNYDKN